MDDSEGGGIERVVEGICAADAQSCSGLCYHVFPYPFQDANCRISSYELGKKFFERQGKN